MSNLTKSHNKNQQINNNSKTKKQIDQSVRTKRLRLSSCFGNLIKTSPQQSETDDEFDDDGGLKPKSILTIGKIIPKQPTLSNTKKQNNDDDDEDEDEDGGISENHIRKRRQQEEEKRKMKIEAKKKKNSIVKLDSEEDEDGGTVKQTTNVNRKQSKTKFQCFPVGDEDDDGVPNRKQSIKEKTSSKGSSSEEAENDGYSTKQSNIKLKTSKVEKRSNKNNEIQKTEKSDDHSSNHSTKRNHLRSASYSKARESKISMGSNNNSRSKVKSVRSTQKTTNDERQAEIDLQIRRRKLARSRWFLAYTLINNYHLFDLRKRIEERLLYVRSEKINQNNSQSTSPSVTKDGNEWKSSENQKTIPSIFVEKSSPTIACMSSAPKTIEYPQSPAERYVATLSQMIFPVNFESPDVNRSPSIFVFPNENLPSPSITTLSPMSPTIFSRQMSHKEHMDRWYADEMKKRQSKQRFAYAYPVRTRKLRSDPLTTYTILVPKII